jgi:hypothetical protein
MSALMVQSIRPDLVGDYAGDEFFVVDGKKYHSYDTAQLVTFIALHR